MKRFFNEELIKILLSIILLVISFFISNENIKLILLVLSYIIISFEMYIKLLKNIKSFEIFDETFLMIIATIGAFFISSYLEAVMVMLLYQIGEYLSELTVSKSKESIIALMDLRVDMALLDNNGSPKEVRIEKVKIGDIFIVKPGEKVPLDGIVVKGESYLDTSSLTGESVPKHVKENDEVLSGCINKDGILRIQATKTSKNSTAQKIVELLESYNTNKSNEEKFISKFASKYTKIVVLSTVLVVLIPTLLGGDFKEWLYKALVFLVTSCPCALVISVPLGYICGIGKASKSGVIIKGSKELEDLSNIDYLMLDKTGTITEGVFKINKIETTLKEEELLKIVASAENNSIHPIADAIKQEYNDKLYEVNDYKEISGQGITCVINKQKVLIGNEKLLKSNNVEFTETTEVGTIIYIAIDNKYVGYILISDKIRKENKDLSILKKCIKKEIIILSGDNENIVKDVAKKVKIDKYYAELLPKDKVKYVNEYKDKGTVMFIGDGINDAPVIKKATVGVSMGNIGSDAAIEASDVVLMKDNLMKIKEVINISKFTKKKITQNIIFALGVKFLVLILSLFGLSTILMATFADVGVTLLSILNVLIIFKKKVY
ncbi:MAG: cadmium-translocating P-type ATPase [Bacilli bacterium]|nr:cadmium-translocating P-type ATPase [Bacilli bacterium]